MAVTQTTEKSSGNGFLYFAVGALIVAVGILAYFYFNGQPSTTTKSDSAIERSADAIGDAAKSIGDSAKDAARNVTPAPTPAPAPVQPAAPTVPPS